MQIKFKHNKRFYSKIYFGQCINLSKPIKKIFSFMGFWRESEVKMGPNKN